MNQFSACIPKIISLAQHTAQQSVHLTLGILRQSQAVFYALPFSQLDGFAVPAPAQVTQTVGRLPYNNIRMDNQKALSKLLIIQGIGFGNLFALFASFLFAIADGVAVQVNGIKLGITESFSLDYSFLKLTFGMGFVLAILPASFGGVVMALIISRNHDKYLSTKKMFGIGLLLGGLSGFILSALIIFILVIVSWSHGANLIGLLIRSTEVTILSSLAGGFTGLCLTSQWKKKISLNTALSQ